jgi:hypothetical protein
MRLTELRPKFLVYEMIDGQQYHRSVDTIGEAHGVIFLCPKCFQANGGSVGTHSVICWSPSVPPEVVPGPGRWNLAGTGFGDLSLVAGSSSVKLSGGCEWHGMVTNGEVT